MLHTLTAALLLSTRVAAVAVGSVRRPDAEATPLQLRAAGTGAQSERLERRVDRLVIDHDHSPDSDHEHHHKGKGTHDHEAGPSIVTLCPVGTTWHGRFCVGLLGSTPVWRDICYTTVVEQPWLGDSAEHVSTYKEYYGACPHDLVCSQDWTAPAGYRPRIDCVPITDDPDRLGLLDKARIGEQESKPWQWRVLGTEEIDPQLVAMGVQIHVKEGDGVPYAAVLGEPRPRFVDMWLT